jgi:hypothetical protein
MAANFPGQAGSGGFRVFATKEHKEHRDNGLCNSFSFAIFAVFCGKLIFGCGCSAMGSLGSFVAVSSLCAHGPDVVRAGLFRLERLHNSYSDYYGPQNTQMTQKRRRNSFFFSAGIPYSADKNIIYFALKNEEGWSLLSFLRFSA